MSTPRQNFYQNLCAAVIAFSTLWLAGRFILPVVWAAILATSTWPLYKRVLVRMGGRKILASSLLTSIVALLVVAPITLVLAKAALDSPAAVAFVTNANLRGIEAPPLIARLPYGSAYVQQWWQSTLALPHGLAHLFSGIPLVRFSSAAELLRVVGARFMHAVIDFGFVSLTLFFIYVHGEELIRQIDRIGGNYVSTIRWQRYRNILATGVISTVNGLILVGMAEGLLLGIAYYIAGMPSPVLWGAATAVLAIIPFGAPIAFLIVAGFLAATGHMTGAIGVAAWGALVLAVADHAIRPRLIGRATRVPFLLVLFGIFGGVETLGLVGLFVGPSLMALFISAWREAAYENEEILPAS